MTYNVIVNLLLFAYVTLAVGTLAIFATLLRLTVRAVAMDVIQIFAAWQSAKLDAAAGQAKVRLMESDAIEKLHASRSRLLDGGS